MEENVITKRLFIDGIPVSVCYRGNNCKNNILILSHWFTGSKENWLKKAEQLARMGFFTVALDNRYHGERKGLSFRERMITADGLLDLLVLRKVIDETAQDVSALIDYYVSGKATDNSNIGIIGISMGGFVGYASLVKDKRISFAVPIISSPFWDDIPENIKVLNTDIAMKKLKNYAAKNSPANQVEKFYPRKIFTLIGTKDIHINAERVIDFYQKLKTVYHADSGYLKINQYDIGHDVNDHMWRDVIKWLKNEILLQ